MDCVFCDRLLENKYHSKICLKCLNDSKVMIDESYIRNNLYLNYYEIRQGNLLCFNYNGILKYLRSDVLEVARKLTEGTSENSSRRKAYLREKELIETIELEQLEFINYKNNVKELIDDYTSKYGIDVNDKIKYHIRRLLDNITATSLSPLNVAIKICDELIPFDKMFKRENAINEFIISVYGENYIDLIKLNKQYNDYIQKNSITVDEAFLECSNIIENYINYNKRKSEIDNLINTNCLKKHLKPAKFHKNYNLYVEKAEGTLEENFNKIKVTLDNLTKKEKRKNKLDKLITSLVPNNKLDIAKNNTAYNNYVNKGGNIDNTVNLIVDFANKN